MYWQDIVQSSTLCLHVRLSPRVCSAVCLYSVCLRLCPAQPACTQPSPAERELVTVTVTACAPILAVDRLADLIVASYTLRPAHNRHNSAFAAPCGAPSTRYTVARALLHLRLREHLSNEPAGDDEPRPVLSPRNFHIHGHSSTYPPPSSI